MVKDLEFFVATIRNKYADFRSFVLNFRKIWGPREVIC
jgi:hypothetical protein